MNALDLLELVVDQTYIDIYDVDKDAYIKEEIGTDEAHDFFEEHDNYFVCSIEASDDRVVLNVSK